MFNLLRMNHGMETIEKNVEIVSTIEYDDMTEEIVQIAHVSHIVAAPSTPRTPRHVLAQGTSTQITSQAMPTSTRSGKQTSSRSSLSSALTNPIKMRSLREIYEDSTPNSFSFFLH